MTSILDADAFVHLPLESEQGHLSLADWYLRWFQGHLNVDHVRVEEPVESREKKQALVGCLPFSAIQSIRLDPALSEFDLGLWADASHRYHKHVYLRIPPLAKSPETSYRSWLFKRLLDRVAAASLLLILGPFLGLIALLLQIKSPGPLFFQQWRVGAKGHLFRIIKFRTMIPNAELYHHQVMGEQQGLHKREDDPRITPIGRWMRKWSVDELPQLINVFRGEMSLVGPRPWAIYDAIRIPWSLQQRLNALPGITGPWQVKTRSSLLDLEAVTAIDLDYLEHWSLTEDLKILLQTIPKVLSGSGAH